MYSETLATSHRGKLKVPAPSPCSSHSSRNLRCWSGRSDATRCTRLPTRTCRGSSSVSSGCKCPTRTTCGAPKSEAHAMTGVASSSTLSCRFNQRTLLDNLARCSLGAELLASVSSFFPRHSISTYASCADHAGSSGCFTAESSSAGARRGRLDERLKCLPDDPVSLNRSARPPFTLRTNPRVHGSSGSDPPRGTARPTH